MKMRCPFTYFTLQPKLLPAILSFRDSYRRCSRNVLQRRRQQRRRRGAASYDNTHDKRYPGKDKHDDRWLSSRQQKSNTQARSLDWASNRQQLGRDVNNRSKFQTNTANLLVSFTTRKWLSGLVSPFVLAPCPAIGEDHPNGFRSNMGLRSRLAYGSLHPNLWRKTSCGS